jgi:hypothetical protein
MCRCQMRVPLHHSQRPPSPEYLYGAKGQPPPSRAGRQTCGGCSAKCSRPTGSHLSPHPPEPSWPFPRPPERTCQARYRSTGTQAPRVQLAHCCFSSPCACRYLIHGARDPAHPTSTIRAGNLARPNLGTVLLLHAEPPKDGSPASAVSSTMPGAVSLAGHGHCTQSACVQHTLRSVGDSCSLLEAHRPGQGRPGRT